MSDSDDVALSERKDHKRKHQGSESNGVTGSGDRRPKVEAMSETGSSKPVKTEVKTRDDDDDEDVPLAKRRRPAGNKSKIKSENGGSSSPAGKSKKPKKEVKEETDSEATEDEDEDKPLKKRAKTNKAAKTKVESEEEEEPDDDEETEDEETQVQFDNSVKWTTLEHNGPWFPPPYEPHGVPLIYDGKELILEPEAEEVATFYAGVIGTDHEKNETFQSNFFSDFLDVLSKQKKPSPIKVFSKCDFSRIYDHLQRQKEAKKTMTKDEKQAVKDAKLKIDEHYGWAQLDGRREQVGNFRIEPPNLFRGRGKHPKTGKLKRRVVPEQVTINIGEGVKVPEPPAGHKWGAVIHDNTVTWLAMWKENVNDSTKYVFFAASSSLKGQSDLKKFEKARELKRHIDRIRKDYRAGLKNKVTAERQKATALYLIDRFALRAGNEKSDDEADTVGCCSLRFEHVSLKPPRTVIFDFLGKDSIRYYNEVEVDEQVFKNLKIFKRDPKKPGDPLFDRLNTGILNKHLNKYMKGLTAKVFRTYNASYTFQEELRKTPKDGSVMEKVLAYNRANRQVAILCNHQRARPKAADSQLGRIRDKIRAYKLELRETRQELLKLEPSLKKKRPELAQDESDLDDDWIEEYRKQVAVKEEENLKKKLEKENEKRKADGLELLEEIKLPKKVPLTSEKLEKKIEMLNEKIKNTKLQMTEKDENMTTALGTSKINYIDPRISVAWAKRYDVPLEKIFNKTLREKFKWAAELENDWTF